MSTAVLARLGGAPSARQGPPGESKGAVNSIGHHVEMIRSGAIGEVRGIKALSLALEARLALAATVLERLSITTTVSSIADA